MKMKAKEDELRKVFQSTVSLCVHRGLMTSERAQSYYRSGETYELCVCVCGFWLNVEAWLHFCIVVVVLCRFSPALDADLRFALDNCPSDDIIGRCLVYVHKVVNANGDREGRQMNPQPQSEVIYHLLMSVDLLLKY